MTRQIDLTVPTPPMQSIAAGPVVPSAGVGQPVTAREQRLVKLGEFLGSWLIRRYSEVRVIARMKVLAFTLLLAFLGLGFTLKISTLNAATGVMGPIEFILASPGAFESVTALVAFIFAAAANIYAGLRRREDERFLFGLAAAPGTRPAVVDAILRKLQN